MSEEPAAYGANLARSRWQMLVAQTCSAHNIPMPSVEHCFALPRMWRFDYAWADRKVAMEQQGGLWVHGRHTRGKALKAEYEKLNEAQILGWIVLMVPTDEIISAKFVTVLRKALASRSTG